MIRIQCKIWTWNTAIFFIKMKQDFITKRTQNKTHSRHMWRRRKTLLHLFTYIFTYSTIISHHQSLWVFENFFHQQNPVAERVLIIFWDQIWIKKNVNIINLLIYFFINVTIWLKEDHIKKYWKILIFFSYHVPKSRILLKSWKLLRFKIIHVKVIELSNL